MEAYIDPVYAWVSALVGPHAVIPGWAWLAGLTMIFWGVLAPGFAAARAREAERERMLSRHPGLKYVAPDR
ncbi:hypothetical protein [Actinoplanes sp. NPDC049681]|uniref:hypothetical protein n=1 Tax=Actinoplanes sp. NPDC049681 TaxID=3363905 RepID=UPI0037B966A5